jgi:hypothetical protein
MAAKMQDRNSNVIAFPQAPRMLGAIHCDSAARAVCSHCGGLLTEGESEDDCSSAALSDRPEQPANAGRTVSPRRNSFR